MSFTVQSNGYANDEFGTYYHGIKTSIIRLEIIEEEEEEVIDVK